MKDENLIKFVELETYIHNTESIDKIVESIKKNILDNIKIPIIIEILWGTFGNRIIRLKIFSEDENISNLIFKNTICKAENIENLYKTLDLRIDKAGNLYVRLNKQKLILNKIVIDDVSDDVIRVKFRVIRRAIKEGIENKIRDICQR